MSKIMMNTTSVIVQEDQRLTIRQLGEMFGISKSSVQVILNEHLYMKRAACRWVPQLLTPLQMEYHVNVFEELLERFNTAGVDFLHNIIMIDKSWMFHYDLEIKYQISQWKTMNMPPPKKVKIVRSAGNVMMIFFFFLP